MIHFNKFFFLVMFSICITSCGRVVDTKKQEKIQKGTINVLIDRKGQYIFESMGLSLKVSSDDNLLEYQLSNSSGQLLLETSEPSMSTVHMWGIVLDGDGKVWIQSSDRGLYVAEKVENNRYKLDYFELDESSVKEIPDDIYKILPNTLKRKYPK